MSGRAKLLFVDDEEHIVSTLNSLFRNGYDVYTATDGRTALDIVRKHQIHVIVSDQRMPEMQGIDLLREVKELSPNTMRVMLTGYSDLAAIIGSINSGEIFRYIYKPWNNKDLKATIDAAADVGLKLAGSSSAIDKVAFLGATERPGILIVDEDPETQAHINQLFGTRCRIFTAAGYETALDVLEREDVSVIVSDVMVGKQDVTQLIKLLKKEYPLIVSVVVTRFNDANMTVGLINQGQIFRYLGKPLHGGQLRASIEASLMYHARCKAQPALLARHQVENAEAGQNAGMTATIMSRLKSLRNSMRAG